MHRGSISRAENVFDNVRSHLTPSNKKYTFYYVALAAAVLFTALNATSQVLSLDTTFGLAGTVEFPVPSRIIRIEPGAAGKMLVISEQDNYYRNKKITRLNMDGSPDDSFGQNGEISLGNTLYNFQTLESMAGLPNGKLLIAGFTAYGSGTCSDPLEIFQKIIRLNENGTVDSTFDQDGRLDWYTMHIVGFSQMNRLENGNYLIARFCFDQIPFCELYEFDASGALLTEKKELKIPATWNIRQVRSVGKTTDNRYLALLTNYSSTYVARFTGDGRPDVSFGNGGIIPVSEANRVDAVHLFNSQKAVISVHTADFKNRFLTAIDLQNGTIDPAFGVNGTLTFAFHSDPQTGNYGQLIQRHEDASWTAALWTDSIFEIIRLNADLTPDYAFAPGGHGWRRLG